MANIVVFDPGDATPVEIDWSDAIGEATLLSVNHILPSPLIKLGETSDDTHSYVGISGAVHGSAYLVEASATLSLTNPDGSPQVVNRQFLLRGFNG